MTSDDSTNYQAELKEAEKIVKKPNEAKDTVIKELQEMEKEIAPFKVENMRKDMSKIYENYHQRILPDKQKEGLQNLLLDNNSNPTALEAIHKQL